MATFTIFLEDLSSDALQRVMRRLENELQPDIEAAVKDGRDRSDAEAEILSDRMNRGNTGIVFDI